MSRLITTEDLFDAPGDVAARMRAFDWSSTPLGPVEGWSASLKTIVKMMLRSRFAMWMAWGPELTFFCNQAYAPTLGIKQQWAIGARSDEVWSEIWPDIGPRIAQVFETEAATWDEDLLLLLERSGYPEETYHTFSYSPLTDDDGSVRGMLCVVTEETERAIAVRRVATLRDLASKTVDATSVDEACEFAMSALATNPQDFPYALIRRFNDARTEAYFVAGAGINVDHPVIKHTIQIADWPRLETALAARAPMATPLTARESELLPRGPWRAPLKEAVIAPMLAKTEHGLSGFIAAGLNPHRRFDAGYRDFVNLVATQIAAAIAKANAYEEERRRAEALAAIDKAKTAFFSNVSHEFRTPLTLMLGPLEDAIRAHPDKDLLLIERNAQRLLRLVNTLLDFSRAEAGRTQAQFEPVDLSALTTDIASSFRSAFEKAGLDLIVQCAPLPRPIAVDRDMWEKIVLNLLSNAFKFTFAGAVTVRLAQDGDDVVFTVADTGVGIPEAELPRVFERFHRIEGQRGRTFEGTGIGLALVHDLVRLHEGSIGVSSRSGEGTRFDVRIPMRVAAEQADHAPEHSAHARAFVDEALRWLPVEPEQDDSAGQALSSEGGRVLLVDDNADMRGYVRRLLREAGYRVEEAEDGQQALDLIAAHPPDLVLSDVMMPRLNGVELVRALRANPAAQILPVILLTARFGEDAEVEGFKSGADDYITKPFNARELVARVRAAIDHARLREQAHNLTKESENRFREMADNAPVMIWVTDADGECTYLNKRWVEFTGQAEEKGLGLGWLDVTHPDDRSGAEQKFLSANERREPFSLEYRLRRCDGAYRWCIDAAAPRWDACGQFVGYIGSVIDISERKQADDRRRLLINELNHRVKNTLAVVQSLATQGLRTRAHNPEAFAEVFLRRLGALAQAHDLLTGANWSGAELTALVKQALVGFADMQRLQIEGPSLHVSPRAAVPLSMALHELATNAAKYGALSNDEGHVRVRWRIAQNGSGAVLDLIWRESLGPRVTAPTRRGFGSRLIENGLRHELDGDLKLDFRAEGLVCTMQLPLEGLAAREVRHEDSLG